MTITVSFNDSTLFKDLTNVVKYSQGFLEGAKNGKQEFLKNLGKQTVKSIKEFIDSMARVDPAMYHHIYEWYSVGDPNARLFNISYTQKEQGLSFNYSFSQSKTIQSGSLEPFYNKAKIMESGIAVKIKPKNSKVLRFIIDGKEVFTSKPIVINNPGGDHTKGSFENVINTFFNNYFTQSFLKISGIYDHLSSPKAFSENLYLAKRGGEAAGKNVGYNWIISIGGLQ